MRPSLSDIDLEAVSVLDEQTMKKIADAFVQFQYPRQEDSQFYLFKDPMKVADYLHVYLRQGLENHQIYSYHDKGFLLLSDASSSSSWLQYFQLLYYLAKYMGLFSFLKYLDINMSAPDSLEVKMRRKKKPFLHVEMLVVLPEYQKQGIMRAMLEEAKKLAASRKVSLILETDCSLKAQRYERLGMEKLSERRITSRLVWHDFIYQPEKTV